MKNNINFLKSLPLFNSINENEILNIIYSLDGFEKEYEQNNIIINYNDKIKNAAIIISGKVNVTMLNCCSNEYLLDKLTEGELFLIDFALNQNNDSIIEVRAQEKSKILFLNLSKLDNFISSKKKYNTQLLINLIKILSAKSIIQNNRIQILIQIHIRHKIILYLSSIFTSKEKFKIPFNRQELANHLNVDRSALSRELGRLKKEGYIDYTKNQIIIKKNLIF